MKDVVGNFYTKCRQRGKRSLFTLLGVSALLASSADAGEKEVWYDAKGVPVLVKDKASGKLRRPTVAELDAYQKRQQVAETKVESVEEVPAVEERIDLEAKLRESIANSNSDSAPTVAPDSAPVPLVADPHAVIPKVLMPQVYDDQRFYVPRQRFYHPYYQSSYPYIFQRTVPRFSRNGSYGPVRYYRPHYHRGYYGNRYGNRHAYGNGYLLRYSRPGFSIRARF